jgi:acetylornithine deacetylase/succinyl-diaminopimelate desuccinylase-like protein
MLAARRQGTITLKLSASILAASFVAVTGSASAQDVPPDLASFRELYKELVEIDTTLSKGDCTVAANALAARLRAGGIPDEDIHVIVPPDFPTQGNIVAVLRGTDPQAEAVLLAGHIDVVEADAADWERDPFTLIEENGFFYARGAADDKAMVSILADTMIRFTQDGFAHRRTLKLAATCGEETSAHFNGMKYLIDHHRDLIDAEFGINENGNGRMNAEGERVMMTIQAGQKIAQNFQLELTGPGGRSSRPQDGNLIYDFSEALVRLSRYEFPADIDVTVRNYFEAAGPVEGGQLGADLLAVLETPVDEEALARVFDNRQYGPVISTTCTTTLLEGGHAWNALPQRVAATVNCRIKPGMEIAHVQQTLKEALGDDRITVEPIGEILQGTTSAPPLTPQIFDPIKQVAADIWPGVPVIPALVPGSDDSRLLTPAGIPTYGISGQFRSADGDGTHALNERIRIEVLYDARDFLYELIKIYSNAGPMYD